MRRGLKEICIMTTNNQWIKLNNKGMQELKEGRISNFSIQDKGEIRREDLTNMSQVASMKMV